MRNQWIIWCNNTLFDILLTKLKNMNNFQQATRIKLRFETVKGSIGIEQLWDLKIVELASAIKNVNKILKESKLEEDELDFLKGAKSKVNEIEQLRFDILKEIYTIRKSEEDEVKNAKAVQEHNEKIDALIAKKQSEELENLTVEELLKLRK